MRRLTAQERAETLLEDRRFTPFALLVEAVRAWSVRSLYCRICGRRTGLWHIERCHKKHELSPGLSIMIILALMLAVIVAFILAAT